MPGLKVTDEFRAPQGVYKVKFGGFSTRDDDGTRVAKATDFGMRAFANLIIVDGQLESEEIPCGMDLEDGIAQWCFLFSGVPPQSSDLAEIEKQMKTDKALTVRVSENGWVQGVFVPKATYLAKFARFAKRDDKTEKPIVATKEFQGEPRPMVFWQFEIVAGDLTGVRVPGSCRYAIRVRGNELELAARSSLYNWLLACGVDFNNLPEFADPENVLPELEEIMQRANVVLSVQVGDNGWVTGDQSAVSPAPAGVTVTQRPSAPQTVKGAPSSEAVNGKAGGVQGSNGSQEPMAVQLIKAIGVKASEFGYGEGAVDGQLTDAGKKFAAEHVAPVCVERGIPRSFSKMSDAQIKELLGVITSLAKNGGSGGDEF